MMRDVENSHNTLSRVGDWGTNVENSWGNPPNTFSEATALDNRRRLGDKCREQLGEPSKESFLKRQLFAPENRERLGDKL